MDPFHLNHCVIHQSDDKFVVSLKYSGKDVYAQLYMKLSTFDTFDGANEYAIKLNNLVHDIGRSCKSDKFFIGQSVVIHPIKLKGRITCLYNDGRPHPIKVIADGEYLSFDLSGRDNGSIGIGPFGDSYITPDDSPTLLSLGIAGTFLDRTTNSWVRGNITRIDVVDYYDIELDGMHNVRTSSVAVDTLGRIISWTNTKFRPHYGTTFAELEETRVHDTTCTWFSDGDVVYRDGGSMTISNITPRSKTVYTLTSLDQSYQITADGDVLSIVEPNSLATYQRCDLQYNDEVFWVTEEGIFTGTVINTRGGTPGFPIIVRRTKSEETFKFSITGHLFEAASTHTRLKRRNDLNIIDIRVGSILEEVISLTDENGRPIHKYEGRYRVVRAHPGDTHPLTVQPIDWLSARLTSLSIVNKKSDRLFVVRNIPQQVNDRVHVLFIDNVTNDKLSTQVGTVIFVNTNKKDEFPIKVMVGDDDIISFNEFGVSDRTGTDIFYTMRGYGK